jgi:RecA/RadA recombinase
MITFTGKIDVKITRVITGFHTLDHALINRKGEMGLPIKTICEVAGPKGVGKSTFVYSLAGIVAKELKSNIALGDVEEHFDPEYVSQVLEHIGFDEKVYNSQHEADNEILQDLAVKLSEKSYSVGILDSIGAVSPISEDEGNLEDANMGRRALLMGKFARRIIKVFRSKETPTILFATNHVHPNMGFAGTSTSGGKVLEYLTSTRIRLSNKEIYDDGSYWLGGKIDNNTFGFSKRVFYVFCLAGYGLHPGLTAVRDCVMLDIAKESKTVKLEDKSYGFFKNMIKKFDDPELFAPFIEALKNHKKAKEEQDQEITQS